MNVRTQLLPDGFRVLVNRTPYNTHYPQTVWQSFPAGLRQQLADTAAYFFTAHLTLVKSGQQLNYDFPSPADRSLFTHGLWYSLPEAVIEIPEAKFRTSQFLKEVYNSEFRQTFSGHPYPTTPVPPHATIPKTVVMPFSFGKDSLLTFALCRSFNLKVNPFFFVEPTSIYENDNKAKLREQFHKEFSVQITPFPLALGNLRQGRGLLWGWDLLLTQYTLLLLPYLHSQKPNYFFWSNEQSTDEKEIDNEGYLINATFEQGVSWTLHLNNLLRQFASNCLLGSLIEPLHELAVLYLLHHSFADIGKYQLSCFNDSPRAKTRRWCGVCYECSRVFIFLLAVGVDPGQVGFVDDMLTMKKKPLYYLFDKKEKEKPFDILFQSWGERLFAFYLAYKRGVKGELISLFEHQLLAFVEERKTQFLQKYLKLQSTKTIPPELKSTVIAFYQKELKKFYAQVRSGELTPVDRSV